MSKPINKWSHLKGEIKSRPLLAYRIGIPIDDLQKYLYSTPSEEEILRIEAIIFQDREVKTEAIRNELSKIVGYRESVSFANKIGISDSKLRNIIQGKDKTPSYEIINRLEIYLNVITGFPISIENFTAAEALVKEEFDYIAEKINSIGKLLLLDTYEVRNLYKLAKLKQGINDEHERKIEWQIQRIRGAQNDLSQTIVRLDSLLETFIRSKRGV